jgi:hypothetical protein
MPEKYVVDISNKNSDENIKNTLDNIDKLLVMAEESEEKILRNDQNILFFAYALISFVIISVTLIFVIKGYNLAFYWEVLFMLLATGIVSFVWFQLKRIEENTRKEKITFETSLEVVQEILPYYFDKMSVLEKTVYNIRLSKLDIVGTETKQES